MKTGTLHLELRLGYHKSKEDMKKIYLSFTCKGGMQWGRTPDILYFIRCYIIQKYFERHFLFYVTKRSRKCIFECEN